MQDVQRWEEKLPGDQNRWLSSLLQQAFVDSGARYCKEDYRSFFKQIALPSPVYGCFVKRFDLCAPLVLCLAQGQALNALEYDTLLAWSPALKSLFKSLKLGLKPVPPHLQPFFYRLYSFRDLLSTVPEQERDVDADVAWTDVSMWEGTASDLRSMSVIAYFMLCLPLSPQANVPYASADCDSDMKQT